MVNATNDQVPSCGNDAFGSFCNCDGLHTEIPQDDFKQVMRAIIVEPSEDDPIVSALDLEMRGLWKP
jgi:hypothetical protein